MIAILFASCSSDNNDDYKVITAEKAKLFSFPLQGAKDLSVSSEKNPTTIYLSDVLGETDSKNFISSEFQRGKSFFQIRGLKNLGTDATLKNFTIGIGNRKGINLGDCVVTSVGNNQFISDTELSADKYTELAKYIHDDLASRSKKTTIWYSFTSNYEFSSTNKPVYMEINVAALFTYRDYTVAE